MEFPDLPNELVPAVKRAEAKARANLTQSIVKHFADLTVEELRSGTYKDLIPYFETYAAELFNAYADNCPTSTVTVSTKIVEELLPRWVHEELIENYLGNREHGVPNPIPGYEGVWEETLAECWPVVAHKKGLVGDKEIAEVWRWRYVWALRTEDRNSATRRRIMAHLEGEIPEAVARRWRTFARHEEAAGGQTLEQIPADDQTTAPTMPGKRRRGPKPDMDRHHSIASVVKGHGLSWRDTRGQICRELDEKQVPVSPKCHEKGIETWCEQFKADPKAFDNALAYALRMSKSTSPTS